MIALYEAGEALKKRCNHINGFKGFYPRIIHKRFCNKSQNVFSIRNIRKFTHLHSATWFRFSAGIFASLQIGMQTNGNLRVLVTFRKVLQITGALG